MQINVPWETANLGLSLTAHTERQAISAPAVNVYIKKNLFKPAYF